jgi:hypothetical protein
MSQRKYLVVLRSQPGNGPGQPPSPEQMQKMYVAFNEWKDKYKNEILDMGGKLKPGGKVVRASGVVDGPFAESKEVIAGFMIVGAADYDGAVRVASECPGAISPNTSVEIRELATM